MAQQQEGAQVETLAAMYNRALLSLPEMKGASTPPQIGKQIEAAIETEG